MSSLETLEHSDHNVQLDMRIHENFQLDDESKTNDDQKIILFTAFFAFSVYNQKNKDITTKKMNKTERQPKIRKSRKSEQGSKFYSK